MFIFLTEVITEDGTVWAGDNVEAISYGHADFILESTGRGYMKVVGILQRLEDEDGVIIDYRAIMSN